MEIGTERLILRGWRESDLGPWAAMNADPEVREHLGDLLTREQSDAAVAAMQAEFGTHISPVSLDVRWLRPNSLAIRLLVRLSAIRFRIRCSPVVNRVISGREFSISRVRQPQRVDMVRAC